MNEAVDRQFIIWRDRAEKAEADNERLRAEIAGAQAMRTDQAIAIGAFLAVLLLMLVCALIGYPNWS